jgi:hypothetical protein
MKTRVLSVAAAILLFSMGCGEEYFATPEKTLENYVKNRMMGSRQEREAALNSFTQADQDWWDANYMKMCTAFYGLDCPGEGISTEATIWTDKFEPSGPNVTTVESSEIDEEKGTAWLTVQGQDIEFIKEKGNWKMVGFFGVTDELKKEYPQLR